MAKIRIGLVGCGFVSELHMYASPGEYTALGKLAILLVALLTGGAVYGTPNRLATFADVLSVAIAGLFGAELRTPHRTALSPASASAPS